jgi:Zn-dependent protease with chaperone function
MSPNDMVLTIGLPLVANLTAREFAGVVAHEFGHFTQGISMRLSYVIGSVNIWFARVVYQRDAWDESLEEWSQEADNGYAAAVVWSTQLGVWFFRLILRVLMFAGFLISGFMSRQMEYNADACQIRVVGSEAFEITHRKLATLSAAMEVTYKQIHATWTTKHQLPDNLSELLRRAHEHLPPLVLQKIDDSLGFHRTGFLDTHPSPADRIREARKAADPGIFHDDRPASSLFASFEHPARFVTLLHYTDDLGIPVTEPMLLHVESGAPKTAAAPTVAVTTNETSNQYFLGVLPLLMPLRLPSPLASANFESDAAELNQLSAGLQHVAEQLAPIAAQYAEASNKLVQARTALRLLQAGVFIQPAEFALTQATVESARAAEAELNSTRDGLRHSVREVGAALNRRLQLGLSLRLSDRGEYGVDAVSAEQAGQLVSSLNQAADDYAHQQELMDSVAVLDKINALKDARGETPPMSKALVAQNEFVNSLCASQSRLVTVGEQKPGLQLQVAKRQQHVSAGNAHGLRQKNLQWFADYGARIEELIQIALPVEGVFV